MRNLLINLTFALALLISSLTSVYSQINLNAGSVGPIAIQDIAVTIEDGTTTTTYRGGIVVPIIQLTTVGTPRDEGVTVDVRVMKGRSNLIYSYTTNYSRNSSVEDFELVIPSSEVDTWESGIYTLVVQSNMETTSNEEDVIHQTITIE